jgi:hypothetical protein
VRSLARLLCTHSLPLAARPSRQVIVAELPPYRPGSSERRNGGSDSSSMPAAALRPATIEKMSLAASQGRPRRPLSCARHAKGFALNPRVADFATICIRLEQQLRPRPRREQRRQRRQQQQRHKPRLQCARRLPVITCNDNPAAALRPACRGLGARKLNLAAGRRLT